MPATSLITDDQAIRELDQEWGAAATRKDLETVVAFYASDGSVVWPGAPAATGTHDIRSAWTGLFCQFDGLSLQYTPDRIDVAESGDIASDFGKVQLGYDTPKGRAEMVAKYVVVWKKVEGGWKVLYDCYNTNTPEA